MKKLAILAALCMVLAVAAPAMATEISVSGEYRVTGGVDVDRNIWDQQNLRDDSDQDRFAQRLRVTTEFKVHDNLKLVTRFDTLDGLEWGTAAGTSTAGDEGITVDRAYMEFITPIGLWRVGRMASGNFGTSFAGTDRDRDSIVWILPVNNWFIAAKYTKHTDRDDNSLASANSDFDQYYLSAVYKAETWEAGLLGGWFDDERGRWAEIPAGSGTAVFLGALTSSTEVGLLDFYAKAAFGGFSFETEWVYGDGEIDFDNPALGDVDLDIWGCYLEGTYNFGPGSVLLGYAFATGDDDGAGDGKLESALALEPSEDFTKLFLLMNNNDQGPLGPQIPAGSTLAGLAPATAAAGFRWNGINQGGGGLISASDNAAYGVSAIYGGINYQVTENVGLGLVIGYVEADEVPAGWDDEYGWEYDLSLTWQIMDNLELTSIFAYLDAGDIYEMGTVADLNNIDIENTYTWYNKLSLTF